MPVPGSVWMANLPMHRSTLQLPELVHVCNDSSHLVNMEGGGFSSNPPSSLGQGWGEKGPIWAQNFRFTVHCCRKIKVAGAGSCWSHDIYQVQ